MSYLKETLIEELERNIRGQEVFEERMSQLRHGSIVIKKIKHKEYIYLVYRKDGSIKYEYIGVNTEELLNEIQNSNKKYKKFKKALQNAKKEERQLRKAIGVF